jgi:outer membrane receptor protein involved in Fe transport
VQDGGYVDNVLGAFDSSGATNAAVVEDDFNDWGVDGGRISALWNVNENWKVLATGLYEKSRSTGDWKSDPTVGEYKIVRFLDDQRDDEWWSTALTITGDLGFAEFTSASAYLEREIAYINDSSVYEQYRSAYFAYGLYDTLTGLGTDHRDFSRTFNDQNQQRFSQELRLTSKGEGRFQWMLGAFYEDVNDEWFFGVRTPRLLDTQSWQVANSYAYNYYAYYDGINFPLEETDIYWAQFYDRAVTQKAIFGEITYDLTDKLRVAAGGRWFEYERDRSETNQLPLGLPTFISSGIDDNLGTDAVQSKDSDTVWKLGLQYDIDEDRMLYALYSEGFRLGGTNSLRVFNEGLAPREYEPDTLRNYEVGFKTTWFDDRVTLNASAFKMEWDQIQSSIFGGGSQWWQNGNVNAGTAETTGLEASAWAQVTDRLTLNGSVFVADAKYTEDFDQFVTRRNGEPLLFSPDSKFWLAAEYTIPDVAFGADLWFRYDYWRQSKSFQNAGDPPTIIPASESSDFQVGFWKDDDWNLTLTVNNIWDQRQIYSFDQGGEFYADFFGTNQYRSLINYNRPREFTVRLRKSFGK